MTLHRFFIEPKYIQNMLVIFPEEISHQITQVLRLKQNDLIIVLDNSGKEYVCSLQKIDKKHTEAKIEKSLQNTNEPEKKVHLYQSLIAKDNFELVLQKAVEIGVSDITPVQTSRSQFNLNWANEKKNRWEKIIKEASEQSERAIIPILYEPIIMKKAVIEATKKSETFIAWEKEPVSPIPLPSHQDASISIFVGPEGGFTEEEILYAKSLKATPISLGKRILRAETASISLLAKVLI